MFTDKLLIVLGLTLFNGAVLNEPQEALRPSPTYEVINATDKNITLEQGYSDEQVRIPSKTRTNYPYTYKTDDDLILYISKTDYPTKPTNFYYIYNAPDFEDPVDIVFNDVPSNVWTATIEGYEPSLGVQIGTYESLIGKTYYYDNETLSNLSTSSIVGDEQVINILDGKTAKLQKEDGSFTATVSEIFIDIVKLPKGYTHLMYLGYKLNGQTVTMATNLDYNSMAMGETKIYPYLVFFNGYTNKVVFQSGNKSIKYGTLKGIDPHGFTPNNYGYKGEQGEIGENNAGWSALEAGIALVGKSFDVVSGFFSWVIFPGITLGLLLLFPILLCMLLWIIKLVKKG